MSDWLEVRVPISPRPDYFNRVHLLARSIRSLGGPYADVRIRVTVGADRPPEDLHARFPWSSDAGIDWVWVDRAEFRRWRNTQHEYIATMMERFRPPFTTRHVLMLDADILAMRRFDELMDLVEAVPGVAAMTAHATPFRQPGSHRRLDLSRILGRRPALDHAAAWRSLFNMSGIAIPAFTYEHSGWQATNDDPAYRFGPPYFNTGVVLASSSALERIYAPYMRALDTVRKAMDTYFFEQVALTLALLETATTFHVLPMRYNFANQREFDKTFPEELAEIRFLHFMRTDVVRREADFETIEAIRKFAARDDLAGSNELLRRRVASLLPSLIAQRELAIERV